MPAQPPASAPRPGRRPKDTAGDARDSLLRAASALFAEQGVAETSTREICTAAGLNPGAIHYHFGDKEGLYRAVLLAPIEALMAEFQGLDDPALPLRELLDGFLAPFMADDGDDPQQRQVFKLFLAEMQQPSPVFAQILRENLTPLHRLIEQAVARHLGLAEPDGLVHQLVYGLQAMAHDYCMSRPLMELTTPGWLSTPGELDRVRERLVDWGVALIDFERQRRQKA